MSGYTPTPRLRCGCTATARTTTRHDCRWWFPLEIGQAFVRVYGWDGALGTLLGRRTR